MSFFKNRRQLVTMLSLILFSGVEVQGTQKQLPRFNEDNRLGISLSVLDKSPKISLLKTDGEKDWYDRLWSSDRTLEENLDNIRNEFVETCCDFSFKNLNELIPGVYLGRFDDIGDVLFTDDGVHIGLKHDLSKVLLISPKDDKKVVRVGLKSRMLPGIRPLSFRNWMKDKFKEYIYKLSEDSVGCDVLRVAIAKYKNDKENNEGRLSKIRFVPVENERIGFSYTVGSTVWRCLSAKQKQMIGDIEEYVVNDNIVVFSPKWIKEDQPGFSIKIREDSEVGEISISSDVYPLEAGLLHHILYVLHDDKLDRLKETKVIESRSNSGKFYGYLPKFGVISTYGSKINASLLRNDEVFRTMFGITSQGIELLNESSYLAHRYGWIRPVPIGMETKFTFNGKSKSVSEFYDLLSSFLEFNADYGLYLYYLASESTIEFPEFGKGAYQYKILDEKVLKEIGETSKTLTTLKNIEKERSEETKILETLNASKEIKKDEVENETGETLKTLKEIGVKEKGRTIEEKEKKRTMEEKYRMGRRRSRMSLSLI